MFPEKSRPEEAWVRSKEGEGMPEKRKDVRDFGRESWLRIRGGVLEERETVANSRVDVCCRKNKSGKREDEDEA